MITVNNKQFRNLEEQVQKNKEDIERYHQVDQVLADWGIRVLGVVPNVGDLPTSGNSYGDAYGVGQPGESNAPWPGERMTTVDSTGSNNYDKLWTATFSKKFQYCIFNDGYKNSGFPASMAEWSPVMSEYSFSSGGGWTALVSTTYQDPGPDLYRVYTYKNNWAEKYVYAWADSQDVTYYVWTRANPSIGQDEDYWLNVGALSLVGPQGPQGPVGPAGPQGVRGSKWYSGKGVPTSGRAEYNNSDYYLNSTNGDIYLYSNQQWTLQGNIRGPQGISGSTGQQGQIGPQGPAGPQGPKGDSGQSFQIAGFIASIDLLPTPTESIRNQAYAVGADGNYDMYVIAPDEGGTLVWVNMGRISGVEGPQGPIGPTGADGIGAIRIPIDANENPLSAEKLNDIINSDTPIIELGDEFFYPADNWEEDIVFSHVGQLEGHTYSKTLSLNKNTGEWTLTTNTFSKAAVELKYNSSQNYDKVFADLLAGTVDYPITIDGKPVWLSGFNYETGSYKETHLWVIDSDSRWTTFTDLGANNYYDYIHITDYVLTNYSTKLDTSGARYMPVSPYKHYPAYGEYTTTTRINDDNSKVSNVKFSFYYRDRYEPRSIGFYNQDSAVSSGYNGIQGDEFYDKGYLGYITAYQFGDGSGSQYYYKVVTPEDVDEKIAAAIDGALEEDY